MVSKCSSYISAGGGVMPMTEAKRTELLGCITAMAQQGLRTLCLAYRDFPSSSDPDSEAFEFPPEEDLTACCIVGIKVELAC